MENKITEEELEKIKEQSDITNKILQDIGFLSAQKHALLHELASVNEKVEKNKQALNEKYGSININVEDGTYTEIKEEEEETPVAHV